MSYTVLARRYRSRSFDELIGQEAIAGALSNAVEAQRVAHAYLFVGTRGVGKTSAARIFAKALNGGSDEVDAAIMEGRDTDVIEIDAASNSKVEETRELIANAIYRPMRGKKKVYIIDEVHMLSSASFNALLKTLEEPPDHVVFVLCTTETHKVPATIQSRCQRFDFRNLSTREIAKHLGNVAEKEGVAADDELLAAVARLGNGSMRDALSLLDRIIAAGEQGATLTVDLLERVLGLPRREGVAKLLEACATGDPKTALETADGLISGGTDIDQLLPAIAERCRDLMVLRVCGPETTLVDLTGASREAAVAQAEQYDEAGLTHMIALCESVSGRLRSSSAPRAVFDALIVRLALTERVASVAALLEGKPAPASASGGGSGGVRKKR
jgi:DNA polymerase III subunit gamma/tau